MNYRILHLLLSAFALIPAHVAPADNNSALFNKDILPILQAKCVQCHGPETQESMVRLDTLSTDLMANRAAAETWHEVLNVLDSAEMPPEDEEQLTEQELAALTGWIRDTLDDYVKARSRRSGRVVHRRLNRVEYQNTMFDLLGLDMDYARDLPPDSPSEDGFQNNGQSLQMSALQLEYYLATARRALDRVIVSGPAPQQYDHEFTESNVRNWRGNVERSNRLQRSQVFLGTMVKDYPEEGEFRVRVTFTAELRPEKGYPILELSVGYRPDTQILFRTVDTVEITSEEQQTLEFRGRLENHPLPVRGQGKFPGLVVRVRNAYDDGSQRPKGKKGKFPDEPNFPVINIQSVQFEAPVFEQWPPVLHRQILGDASERPDDEADWANQVLTRFLPRAFRRPVSDQEVERFVEFFRTVRPEFPTVEEALRETLTMVLISPDFLYLVEPAGEEKRPVTSAELASRLSYFLWSTMPDEKLAEQVPKDALLRKEVLAREVERLLDDDRSQRLIDQFTRQWLNLDVVDRVAVSKNDYPKFSESLKQDMVGETQQFFAFLLKENESALKLLDSDFTMLNESLAQHYGYPDVWGQEFRPVNLRADDHRGGLLSHASVLLSNSTGADSHAVRRAVWIRDRLLDDPPAPPPPDVPTLDEADPEFLKLSVREQLEVHRERAACASCHKDIDPWGIALENFDAVGLWREEVSRQKGLKFDKLPVNSVDTLPDGQELNGIDGLRTYLLQHRKEQFARALVARLLTYALGRELELTDEQAVDDLTKKFVKNDYRLRDLVKQIVASDAFQTK